MSRPESQEERDRNIPEIKTLIKDNLHSTNISVFDNPKGLHFKTKYGKILIPNESIEYYYTVFNETIQKIKKYEGYIDRIDGIIESKSPDELCKELKALIDWFNFSEVFGENYTVVSQWLSDDDVTKDMLALLYKAYSLETTANLDEMLIQKYVNAIKKSLSYYSILLKMFDIIDTTIFNRKD